MDNILHHLTPRGMKLLGLITAIVFFITITSESRITGTFGFISTLILGTMYAVALSAQEDES